MTDTGITALRDCLRRYQSAIPALAEIAGQLPADEQALDACRLAGLIALYERAYPLLERAMWSDDSDFEPLLDCYQTLFREQEALIHRRGNDDRHHFILSIPVADRPPHLQACLESILQVCQRFDYGGHSSGSWDRIRIVVAEDSRDEASIRRHLELVDEYRDKGLDVIHFGQEEQYALLQAIPPQLRVKLGNILTTQPRDRFYLKGQAANRNLSYLKCLQLTADRDRTLYYLIDSDQSLCVNRQTESGEEVSYALNYFHYIDRIFRNSDTRMLTGKMVGDPPVSPSVMAVNFLDDVTAFFERLAGLQADQTCLFHDRPDKPADDAAYHDMAKLFGYEARQATYPYQCQLQGEHDHAACLRGFTSRLNAFFFGEHLTRKTCFSYGKDFTELSPARTIYPGNYIVNREGLKYIIPFGHLRLRMSGPTAGRLIAAEIGDRFASFNMPNLHRRTSEEGLNEDFRPGVELAEESIDLSNEFERQFFGDLMLFSTAELVTQADVSKPFPRETLDSVIGKKEQELLELYRQKHEAILERSSRLEKLVFESGRWWQEIPELAGSLRQVRSFLDNIERNFGGQSPAWQKILSERHRAERKGQIADALLHYREERDAWDQLFS